MCRVRLEGLSTCLRQGHRQTWIQESTIRRPNGLLVNTGKAKWRSIKVHTQYIPHLTKGSFTPDVSCCVVVALHWSKTLNKLGVFTPDVLQHRNTTHYVVWKNLNTWYTNSTVFLMIYVLFRCLCVCVCSCFIFFFCCCFTWYGPLVWCK